MLLPLGESDFEEIIQGKFVFVDKSLLIEEMIEDNKVVLITRPRRFGKTLNLSMLRYFFSQTVDDRPTKPLFDKLAIRQKTAIFEQYQGKYPVISLSFKDVKEDSFKNAYVGIFDIITELYHQHRYLLTSKKLSKEQKEVYKTILNQTATETKIKNALKNLITYLYEHNNSNVVVLIDEYDTPIQSGYLYNYYEKIVRFFRNFFGAALKDNKYVFKAVLTGILRTGKENLFSGMNNLVSYSMLKQKYSAYFGFTEQEVEDLLKKARLEKTANDVKQWYNGYKIHSETLYNPWSIASYIKDKQLQPYWVNTSDNALIRDLLTKSNALFKEELETLLKGGSIRYFITDDFVFADLKQQNVSTLWNLMFMSGYLKVNTYENTERGLKYNLSIPNKEIHKLYQQIIENWISGDRGFEWFDNFLNHLLNGNIPLFKEDLQCILDQVVSTHDTARHPEAFYHGLVIGLTANLHNNKNYELHSNHESGEGRYDYLIISRNPKKLSILMEFKKAKSNELKKTAKAALQQIDLKNYTVEARQRGIQKLLKIGIAFSGKKYVLEHALETLTPADEPPTTAD